MAESTHPVAPPEGDADFVWTRAKVIILTVLCLAQFLEAIDVTVVNVALPTIKNDLGFTQADLQWVVNAYTVLFGGFMLLGGRAGDLLGHRRVFIAGVALFTLASLGSGLAQSGGLLIAMRGVQGLAAAFIGPLTLAMIATSFPEGKARNRAVGTWGAVAGVSGVVGLLLGGLLTDGPGWRWVFFINVPVGVAMLACWKFLTKSERARGSKRFDAIGAVAVTAGVGLLAYGIVQTDRHPWGSARTILLLAAAAALLVYFVIHEAFVAAQPLVPLSLFRNRAVTGANLVMALSNAGLYTTSLLATLYMQQVLHYSPLKTGLAFLPMTLSMLAFAGLGPALVPRIGIRFTMAIGLVVGSAGLLLFSRVSPDGSFLGDLLAPSLLLGSGAALMLIPITIAAEHGVPAERHGIAAGMINVTRLTGGSLGIAVLATLATERTNHLLGGHQPAASALTSGLRLGFAIGAGLMLAAAVVTVAIFRNEGRKPKERADQVPAAALAVEE